jgi:adenylate cyclase
MYRLTYQDGETPQSYSFSTGEVVIGRSPECQVVLKDFGISRNHAKLVVADDGVRIVDLKSKNGTQVNGVPVVEAHLKDGDRILLGKFAMAFGKNLESKIEVEEREKVLEEGGTIIRSVGELSRLLAPEQVAPQRAAEQAKKPADVQEIERSNRILKVLTEFSKALISVSALEDVLAQVVDIVFDHIPADRGFLMLIDENSGRLQPMVVKHREPGQEQGKITISKTIVERVIKDRVSILSNDAQYDSRFGAQDSIRIGSIRSAMCAPLWNKEQVVGIVHVDSNMLTNLFTANDLDLLGALANYAAVAVERARLTQKVVAEEKKRERLGRFLSPQVTNRILATSESQSIGLGIPEVREVTILFSDLVGFTSMSERMSPAAVALLLNEYLGRMTDIIFKFEGTLDKYIGDAIMAVFGAPLDMPDHPAQAIRAALEMRERLEEFNAERREGPVLRMRIGINTGKVVVGEIGSINKKEFTVLGDAVNTASRLESSVAKPMMIVIGPTTYEAVRGEFECNSLGVVALKGKEKQVEAYEVVGPLEGALADHTPASGAATGRH